MFGRMKTKRPLLEKYSVYGFKLELCGKLVHWTHVAIVGNWSALEERCRLTEGGCLSGFLKFLDQSESEFNNQFPPINYFPSIHLRL